MSTTSEAIEKAPITISAFGTGPILIRSFNGIDGKSYLLREKKKMSDYDKERVLKYKDGKPVGTILLNRSFVIPRDEEKVIEALKQHPYLEGNGGIALFTINDPAEKLKDELSAAEYEEKFLEMIMNITDDEVRDLCDALDITSTTVDIKLERRNLRKRYEKDVASIKLFKSYFQMADDKEEIYQLKKEYAVKGAVRRAIKKNIVKVDNTGEHYYKTESLGMNYDQAIKNLLSNEAITPFFTQIKAALGEINLDKNKK